MIAVASGGSAQAELRQAGAADVLNSLLDVDRLVGMITGRSA